MLLLLVGPKSGVEMVDQALILVNGDDKIEDAVDECAMMLDAETSDVEVLGRWEIKEKDAYLIEAMRPYIG